MSAGVWWIRRDLRLHDNPALTAAAAAGAVIPVFVLDPHLGGKTMDTPRGAFFRASLRALDASLHALGSRLVIRSGHPADVLEQLVRETAATVVAATEDISPYARRRDAAVAARVPLRLVGGPTVLAPRLATRSDGAPYLVFAAFRRAWLDRVSRRTLTTQPAPGRFARLQQVAGDPPPSGPPAPAEFPSGEQEGRRRLHAFTIGPEAGAYHYAVTRDRLDAEGSARLSPYLRAGVLSPTEVVGAAMRAIDEAPHVDARRSAQRWLDELIWREFYLALYAHRPALRNTALRPRFRDFPWLNHEDAFAAWKAGRTGYPVVDAAMRQLSTAGWIPNRARMIVASFLTKHLLIDWRWGARHFLERLIDGDPAANSGGWQWVVGSGTEAAPYFRVFNPVLQGQAWDPHGAYVRRWVPELARVPAEYVHTPWEMPREAQRRAGCAVGADYPLPVVDHATARARALAASKEASRAIRTA